jgi:hypothetical protein
MADKRESNKESVTLREDESIVPLRNINSLNVKVNMDCSEALKGLKAVTRAAKKATAALKELEEQKIKMTESVEIPINLDGKQIAKIMEDHMNKIRSSGASI